MKAAIDCGTHTCLLLVMDGERTLLDLARVVKLGQGVDKTKTISEEAVSRFIDCLKEFSEKITSFGLLPQDVNCVATSFA